MGFVRWRMAIACLLITAAAVWGLVLWRRTDADGTILVLGVTAGVAAWYAEETRLLAAETRRLAESTLAMARVNAYPDVQVSYERLNVYHDSSYIANRGPGAAYDVSVYACIWGTTGGEPCFHRKVIPPSVPRLPLPDYLISAGGLVVTWRDALGTSYSAVWRLDGGAWQWVTDVLPVTGTENDHRGQEAR